MADVTINVLTETLAPASGDEIELQLAGGGASRKATLANITKALSPMVVAVTGTTKTLALSDANTQQHCSNAAAQTITIPPNATAAFAVGSQVGFIQVGAGALSITGGAGVSLNGISTGSATVSAQYGVCLIVKIATDAWVISGGVGAVS